MPKDVSYGGEKKNKDDKDRIQDMARGKMDKSYTNELFRAVDNFLFEFGLIPGSKQHKDPKPEDK